MKLEFTTPDRGRGTHDEALGKLFKRTGLTATDFSSLVEHVLFTNVVEKRLRIDEGGSKTMFTVPLHVGQNIEVPEGSKVTYYKPGHSVMDFPENWKSENRCHHGVWLADHCFECEKRDNQDFTND